MCDLVKNSLKFVAKILLCSWIFGDPVSRASEQRTLRARQSHDVAHCGQRDGFHVQPTEHALMGCELETWPKHSHPAARSAYLGWVG